MKKIDIRLVFFVLFIAYNLYSAIRIKFYALPAVFLLFVFIVFLANKYSQARWVAILFCRRGARTDVKYMTKKDLYESGLQFLVYSVYFFAVMGLLMYFFLKNENMILLAFTAGSLLLFASFFFGGLYLLVRGLFRKKNYIPSGYIEHF